MRVLMINTYSWLQKGDAAIVLGTVEALRRLDPGVQIDIVSATPDIDRAPFAREGVGVLGGPFGYMYEPGKSFAWRALTLATNTALLLLSLLIFRLTSFTRLPLPISTRALMQHIVQADLVISVGGGFWTENSRRALYFHLLQVVCALVAKRRVISLGVSLGPFRSLWRARLTGAILNRTSAVVLREKESFPVAQAMGMDPHKVHLGADMAFGLAPSMAAPQKAADGPHRRFGITAKNWIFPKADDPKAAQVHYEQVLARTIDQLVEHFDAEVLFLPQVIGPETDDDRIVQRRIAGAMRHGNRATVLDSNFSPKELVSLIRDLDFVIATRFHSAIFTMLANVPVVAIAYEHKTTGIMDLLGLGRWVLPIEQVNEAQIVNLCTSIMAERDAVQQHLARAVDAMCQQAYLSAATYASIPAPAQRVLDVKAHQ